MEIVAFLLAVIAVACFALSALNVAARVHLIGLGLALSTTAWIVQLLTAARQVHF